MRHILYDARGAPLTKRGLPGRERLGNAAASAGTDWPGDQDPCESRAPSDHFVGLGHHQIGCYNNLGHGQARRSHHRAAGSERKFPAPLAVDELWGIGPKTAAMRAGEAVHTIEKLAAQSEGGVVPG